MQRRPAFALHRWYGCPDTFMNVLALQSNLAHGIPGHGFKSLGTRDATRSWPKSRRSATPPAPASAPPAPPIPSAALS